MCEKKEDDPERTDGSFMPRVDNSVPDDEAVLEKRRTSFSAQARRLSSNLKENINIMIQAGTISRNDRIWTQIYGSVVSSLGFLASAAIGGWSGAVLTQLDEEFSMGPTSTALIVSLVGFGGLIGSLLSGKCADIFGRKRLLLIICPMTACSWIIIAWASSVKVICIGRFISGFGTGFFFTTPQLYISEITQPSLRGRLGSLTSLSMATGVLLSLAVGSFVTWRVSCYLLMIPLVVFFFGILPLPESPYWYVLKNRRTDAASSLIYFRGQNPIKVEKELNEMDAKMHSIGADTSYKEFLKGRTMRPLMVGIFTQCANQLSAASLCMMFTSKIVEAIDRRLDVAYVTTTIGISQLISTAVSLTIMDRLERRTFLFISALSGAVFTTALASYFLSLNYGVVWSMWLPLLFLNGIVFCFGIGCRGVPFIVASEIFNTSIRSRANALCMVSNRILNLLITQFYPLVRLSIGDYGVFFIFGGLSLLIAGLSCVVVPKTKGKSLEEIQDYFEGKKKKTKEEGRKVGISNPALVVEEGLQRDKVTGQLEQSGLE